MLIGYARVSTQEQTLDLQLDALKSAGCKRIFTDKASGASQERKGLDEALSHLRDGDSLVVWRLDRLGRSLKHLIQTITDLNDRGIGFQSLHEKIDTTTSSGKLIFHIFGALAEFERDINRDRTRAGLEAARARGKQGGRNFRLTPTQVAHLRKLAADKNTTIKELCQIFKISRPTLWRYIKGRT